MIKRLGRHKKLIFLLAAAVFLVLICTTAGLSSSKTPLNVSEISTCSKPEGRVVAKGIDVSRYQGDIDFEKVKSDGYDFVILRAGTSQGGKDSSFDAYYDSAEKAGLDIGCYFYTYDTTVEGAEKEAADVLSFLGGKELSYPVFLDFEYEELLSYERTETNTGMINAFCDTIKQGGYYPGVYIASSVYRNYIDSDALGNKWDFWVASYQDHTPDYMGYSETFSMWQYTNKGSVSGINSDVDLNVSYVDYPDLINKFKEQLSNIK